MRALWSDRPNCSHNVSQKVKRIRRVSGLYCKPLSPFRCQCTNKKQRLPLQKQQGISGRRAVAGGAAVQAESSAASAEEVENLGSWR